jgi:thioredoxin-like negative regulator of GroEL
MRIRFITFLITLGLLGGSFRAGSQQPEWGNSLPEALRASEESGRPVFVEYWAVQCHYCKELEIEFETHEFQRVLSQFVKVRINSDEETELVRRYEIPTLPSTLVLDDRGNIIMKSVGRTKRIALLRRLTSAYNDYTQYLAQRDEVDDPQALKRRGDYLLASGYPEGAITILEDLQSRLTPTDRSLAEQARFSLALGYLGIHAYSRATEIFKELADKALFSELRKDAKEALKMAELLMEAQGPVPSRTAPDN